MNESNTSWIPVTPEAAATPTVPPKQRRLLHFSKKDGVFAVIILLITFLITNSVLFSGYNLGFSIATTLMITVCSIYCFSRSIKPTVFSFFCSLSAILIGATFTIYNDRFITLCGSVLILVLFASGILGITGQNCYEADDDRSVFDIFRFWFKLPFKKVGITLSSLFASKSKKGGKNIGIILAGIFCAIPVAMIVFALLIRSDAAFEVFLKKIIHTDNFAEPIVTIFLGTGFFILFFSIIFSLAKKDAKAEPSAPSLGVLPAGAVTAFLSVISCVYVLYMVSQLTYFFNAFWGILPENFSYSDYARRGFFEMCIICFINLGIIILTLSLVKKNAENRRVTTSVKFVTTFIAAFSFLLTVTAISKMFLYMDEQGLTRKRIITSVFMIIMLIVLAVTIIKIFMKKLPAVKIIIAAVTVIGLIVCCADIDSTVARYNTEKYLAGEIKLDAGFMDELSDSAVPYIIKLAKSDTPIAEDAKKELWYRYFNHFGTSDTVDNFEYNLQEYNYSTINAKILLLDNYSLFCDVLDYYDYW